MAETPEGAIGSGLKALAGHADYRESGLGAGGFGFFAGEFIEHAEHATGLGEFGPWA